MLTFNKILDTFQDWQDVGPSYEDPDLMIYSGDLWALAKMFSGESTDTKTLNRITDLAERYGVELRFYDETLTDEQGRVHNTSPSHYGWIPTYKVFDCEVWAQDEVDSGTLEQYAENLLDDDNNADQWGIDFSPLGFRQWQDIGESGFHHGQNDTPDKMRQAIESKHGECEIIWYIDSAGQFDCHFGAWFKPVK